MDEEYYLLTLMAIARELNVFSIREADVHLAAGLPLTWIRNQREAFRSYLLQNPEVHYRFNGKEYHLRFVGCCLYPQGYPAIVNQLENFKGTNLLADIGNGTMNILYINNKKAQENPSFMIYGGAFRPHIVKVGALSAPTQEMLLKYCLDLSYIQNGSYLFLLFVKT